MLQEVFFDRKICIFEYKLKFKKRKGLYNHKKILITVIICLIAGIISFSQNTKNGQDISSGNNKSEYALMIDFYTRSKQHANELIKLTGKKLHCFISEDPSESFCYIYITEKQLKKYFNLEILLRVIKGAGNMMNTDAHYYNISHIDDLFPHLKRN